MGDCSVMLTIENEAPIEFLIGDYLEYRGERFEINYDPGKIKCARKDSYGGAFKYDSVKFNAMLDELVRSEFLDVVLSDNQLHYTALPKFVFYVSSLDDLLDRIQANMNEQYGEGLWKFYSRNKERSVQRGCIESAWQEMYGDGTTDNEIESQSLSASSNTCWEALAWVNTAFDVNFIVRGRDVYVGTAGIPTTNIFKYGKGNGLYELSQNADSDQLVTTRLRAYGSSKNLPTRYYAEYGVTYAANVLSASVPSSTSSVIAVLDMDWSSAYFTTKAPDANGGYDNSSSGYVVTVKVGDVETVANIGPNVYVIDGEEKKKIHVLVRYQDGSTRPDYTTKDLFEAFKAAVAAGSTMELVSGFVWSKLPSSTKVYNADNLPDNMAVSTLMLPGFPKQSLQSWWDAQSEATRKLICGGSKGHRFSTERYRPYVDSENADVIGVRPASVFFDTDDEANGIIEIYPTIEGMEVGGVRIDEIGTGTEGIVTDNGVYAEGATVPNFDIYLKSAVNFDINALKQSDFTVYMKDGMCGGREFKVAASSKVDGCWRLRLERQKDEDLGLYFPYKDFPIKTGDHFVLTGIELPDEYVEAASEKLLKYAIAYLDENDYTRYTYTPKVDEIFMARQHDKAMADATGATKSLHDTLKAGDLMLFDDEDLQIGGEVAIDKLTISEKDGAIPTYDITLREDKEVGTIQKIKNQLSSLAGGGVGGGVGGGANPSQYGSLVETYGKNLFISKKEADEAEDEIAFKKGAKFGPDAHDSKWGVDENGNAVLSNIEVARVTDDIEATVHALLGEVGFDLYRDASGRSHLWVDELMVRVKAYFASLEIRKVSYSGGTQIFSNAGSTIVAVEDVLGDDGSTIGYKCYATADDGTTRTMNWWQVGDQALCQTFNVGEGTVGTATANAQNRYYWRLVTEVGQELNEQDGKTYDYVVLSNEAAFVGGLVEGDTGTTYIGYDTNAACDVPWAGDVIVQVGSQTNAGGRGNVIMLQTSTESAPRGVENPEGASAPAIRMYYAISDYSWDDSYLTHLFSPGMTYMNSARVRTFSGSLKNARPLVVNRGEWQGDEEYSYYEQVTHDGQLWTWMDASSSPQKGVVPSAESGWTLTVAKGESGTAVTVESVSVMYCISSDGQNAPTDSGELASLAWGETVLTWGGSEVGVPISDAGWSEEIPEATRERPYLWTRTVTTYSDGTEAVSYSVSRIGDDGEPGEDAVQILILTDRGDILKTGLEETTLTAYVLMGGEDVTERFEQSNFKWTRTSSDAASDTAWNTAHEGVGRSITVTKSEVFRRALFECELDTTKLYS